MFASLQESHDKPMQCAEQQRYYSADKGLSSRSYSLPSGHAQLWDLDSKEGRALKNWCLWTMVQENTSESPLDSKEIKSFSLKGNQPWTLIGRMDAEVETPIFCSSDENSWLIRKVPDAGKEWGQKEMKVLEDEMAGWHHLMQWTWTWDGAGQRGLACCSPRGRKELDMTGQLNNNSKDW